MTRGLQILQYISELLDPSNEELKRAVELACQENRWFTQPNYFNAIKQIRNHLLKESELEEIGSLYNKPSSELTIGLVLAGNIPLVGIHDLICVILSGHGFKVKLSDKDNRVYSYLLKHIHGRFPKTERLYQIVDRLSDFDAVIATGSNNSSRYFEYYFARYPRIIRKNRNSVAVLTGKESDEQLRLFKEDVYSYFGLGCRNVSKIYVPKNYDFIPLLEALKDDSLLDHNKYKNNYDYNLTIFIMNKHHYLTNGNILLIEDEKIPSRIATLHFEYYKPKKLKEDLETLKDEIQVIVSKSTFKNIPSVNFGASQKPRFTDFADGVDVMQFLSAVV